jgi:hypothetical protein
MKLKTRLDTYCEAFNRRQSSVALALFCDQALFEFPLLGQRLVGRGEIGAGLSRIFALTESAALSVIAHRESPRLVIAEGRLDAKLHRDASPLAIPLAMTLEAREDGISRLSTYLDARPYRLWADGILCAPPGDADARGA